MADDDLYVRLSSVDVPGFEAVLRRRTLMAQLLHGPLDDRTGYRVVLGYQDLQSNSLL